MATYTLAQLGDLIKELSFNDNCKVTLLVGQVGDDEYQVVKVDSDGNIVVDSTVTMTHTAPEIGASSTLVIAANTNRKYLCLINDSSEEIYINIGGTAAVNTGIRIPASGGSYEMSSKLGNLSTAAIAGICASGGMTLLVTEGV